jgi:hypothetical protein
MVPCSKCGTKNPEHAEFCTNCGGSLFSSKGNQIPEDKCFGKENSSRDYMGYLSFGSFLLILGLVITTNSNLISDFSVWFTQLINEKNWIRPPEELINSVMLFFGLLGGTNFLIAALRLIFIRRRRQVLSDVLSGFALLCFAYLFNLYNDYVLRFRMVLALEVVICGLLIVLYSIFWYIFHKQDS